MEKLKTFIFLNIPAFRGGGGHTFFNMACMFSMYIMYVTNAMYAMYAKYATFVTTRTHTFVPKHSETLKNYPIFLILVHNVHST